MFVRVPYKYTKIPLGPGVRGVSMSARFSVADVLSDLELEPIGLPPPERVWYRSHVFSGRKDAGAVLFLNLELSDTKVYEP